MQSGVGVSTIISFESRQRMPMRSNMDALKRALDGAGITLLDADEHGRGVRLTRSAEALRDLLLIGGLKCPLKERQEKAKDRIKQFETDAMAFYKDFYGKSRENHARARTQFENLRNTVDADIERRSQLQRDDEPTRFLEWITDYLPGR